MSQVHPAATPASTPRSDAKFAAIAQTSDAAAIDLLDFIVREFEGGLTAANGDGGAVMTLVLPAAEA